MIVTDICIIGAGPAGAAAALQLNRDGIDCVIVDKAIFPRDKVCGDGLSGKVLTTLKRIDPDVAARLGQFAGKADSGGVRFVAPNRRSVDISGGMTEPEVDGSMQNAPIGYVCKRMDFDHFLARELRNCKHVKFFEGVEISDFRLGEDGYMLWNKDGFNIKARILIVANGAHSSFSKEVAGIKMEPAHYMAGLRAYYKNVQGNHPDNFIELHFLKGLLPGYFWIFPLPGGEANVGLGMPSNVLQKKKINLKKELLRIIDEDPVIRERFKEASLTGKIEGYGLPLGSKKRRLSGERYLLTGDAASLIDPFTGEGIGNAFYSGRIAAQQAVQALKNNDFSAKALLRYDAEIDRVIGAELRLSARLQRLVRVPLLFNLLMNISARNKKLQELMSGMFYEVDLRKMLTRPGFYLRLIFNRP